MILRKIFISATDRLLLTAFIRILQKRGNKQRAVSSLLNIFEYLIKALAGYPIEKKYPLTHLRTKTQFKLSKGAL